MQVICRLNKKCKFSIDQGENCHHSRIHEFEEYCDLDVSDDYDDCRCSEIYLRKQKLEKLNESR